MCGFAFLIHTHPKLAKEVTAKPGPGQYPVYSAINNTGIYFLSKYKSSLCRTFGGRVITPGVGVVPPQTPGPGTYQAPSEFGIYRAQDKYLHEAEKAERSIRTTSRVHHKKSESQCSIRSQQVLSRTGKLLTHSSVVAIPKADPKMMEAKLEAKPEAKTETKPEEKAPVA